MATIGTGTPGNESMREGEREGGREGGREGVKPIIKKYGSMDLCMK